MGRSFIFVDVLYSIAQDDMERMCSNYLVSEEKRRIRD